MMKRIIAVILAAVTVLTLFSACGSKQKAYPATHTVYFKDITKSEKSVATFYNSADKTSTEVDMEVVSKDNDATIFSCEGDCQTYNMVYFTYGDKKSDEFGFNPCISGWCNTEDNDYLPYLYGDEIDYSPKFDDITLTGYGYEKIIHIWKPDGYDASSGEKYSTIYALDGQMSVINGRNDQNLKGCPMFNEQIKAMDRLTGEKTILVLVENHVTRDNELVPKIGESFDQKMRDGEEIEYDSMDGTQFAEFVAATLVPYVQENYNVYTDARHTAITGASLGGLEAFYITMEHPELFGTVGALSPSVWEFDDAVWTEYLSKKSFDEESSPFVYLYVGKDKQDTDPVTTEMYQRLQKMDYPADKLVLHKNENGLHSSFYWRGVFSEFLTAMVYRRIAPLQNGSCQNNSYSEK